MKPTEIIYNGYIDERQSIDTEETNEAADNLMGMIESLLPFSECRKLIMGKGGSKAG